MIATVITISLSQLSTGSGANGVAQAGRAPASTEVGGSNPLRLVAPEKCPSARKAVRFYQRRYAEHRAKMGAGSTDAHKSRMACPRYLARVWQRKALAARKAYESWFTTLYEKWRCIHEHEGAWNSNTGNGYWGGLQMDWGFMHTYGPEFIRRYGLAHRWPVWAQLVAAERAFHGFAGFGGRGYSPWGTRGMCGV